MLFNLEDLVLDEGKLQGPVARKVDNFIQRIVNFSIAVERH